MTNGLLQKFSVDPLSAANGLAQNGVLQCAQLAVLIVNLTFDQIIWRAGKSGRSPSRAPPRSSLRVVCPWRCPPSPPPPPQDVHGCVPGRVVRCTHCVIAACTVSAVQLHALCHPLTLVVPVRRKCSELVLVINDDQLALHLPRAEGAAPGYQPGYWAYCVVAGQVGKPAVPLWRPLCSNYP